MAAGFYFAQIHHASLVTSQSSGQEVCHVAEFTFIVGGTKRIKATFKGDGLKDILKSLGLKQSTGLPELARLKGKECVVFVSEAPQLKLGPAEWCIETVFSASGFCREQASGA